MKVLMVSPRIKGIGGIARYLRELVVRLRRKRVEIELMNCNFYPCVPIKGLSNPSLVISGNISSLAKKIAGNHYDVLHIHHIFGYYAVRPIAENNILLTLHGDFSEQMKIIYGKRYSGIFDFIESKAVLNSKIVTSISPYISILYSRKYGLNVLTTPNAIDPQRFPSKGTKITDKYQVIFAGRLSPEKGVYILLEAARHLFKQQKNVDIIIVGKGHLEPLLRKHKHPNIIYLGEQPHYNTLKLIKGSDVLVLPSYKEGFPTVILEALAMKTPVIASNIPEIKWIFRKNTIFYFRKGNPIDLAYKIQEVLKNYEKAQQVTDEGHRLVVNNYTWDKTVERLYNLYRKI